jgi:hypothetical protein
MLRVALVFAQLEREQTSERVTDVCNYRAEQGLYNGGTRPFGYISVNKELVPDKQEKKVGEMMFDKFIETHSTARVAHELNAMGARTYNGKLWDKRYVHVLLKKPVYIGKVQWNGKIHDGIHRPIITEGTFKKVQDIFQKKNYTSPRNRVSGLLKGLACCGQCGSGLSPNYTLKSKTGARYYYYRCISTLNLVKKGSARCTNKYLPFKTLHQQVFEAILSHASEDAMAQTQAIINQHNEKLESRCKKLVGDMVKLRQTTETVRQKRERYFDSLLTGKFTPAERKRINGKIDDFAIEEKQLQATYYKLEFERNSHQDQLLSIGPFKQAIAELKINHTAMTDDELHRWLHTNIAKITVSEQEVKIDFKARTGFSI